MRTAVAQYLSDSSIERLDRVIAAATRILSQSGMEGLTIRSLARESQVTTRTLYQRFGSKDNIIALVIIDAYERSVDPYQKLSRADDQPLDALLRLLDLLVQLMRANANFARALMAVYFKHETPRLLPSRLFEILLQRFRPIIANMESTQRLQHWITSERAACEITHLTLSACFQWTQGAIEEAHLYDASSFRILTFLRGISEKTQAKAIGSVLKTIAPRLIGPSELGKAPV